MCYARRRPLRRSPTEYHRSLASSTRARSTFLLAAGAGKGAVFYVLLRIADDVMTIRARVPFGGEWLRHVPAADRLL